MNHRSEALAARLEAGATALAAFAATLYPVEIHPASLLAAGQPVTGVTWDAVDKINRDHAAENDGITKEGALASPGSEQPLG